MITERNRFANVKFMFCEFTFTFRQFYVRMELYGTWSITTNKNRNVSIRDLGNCIYVLSHFYVMTSWQKQDTSEDLPNKPQFSLFTARKQSCGKVMLLHLSVSHSVHRGGEGLPGQRPTSGQRPPCTLTTGQYASYWNALLLKY